MDPAHTIRDAIAQVFALRAKAAAEPELGQAVRAIKRLQARRFRGSYADLLQSADFGEAARFFLDELYGERDYAERDTQFARIAGGLAAVLPGPVMGTAVALAQLHALTEELDHAMAAQWQLLRKAAAASETEAYVQAWKAVGRRQDRQRQLEGVMQIGTQLAAVTGKPGLATVLKLMRRPAAAAGLASLQLFLETGFGIFRTLARSDPKAQAFLQTIAQRESAWLQALFEAPAAGQAQALGKLVAQR
jgi:hypothetical protein